LQAPCWGGGPCAVQKKALGYSLEKFPDLPQGGKGEGKRDAGGQPDPLKKLAPTRTEGKFPLNKKNKKLGGYRKLHLLICLSVGGGPRWGYKRKGRGVVAATVGVGLVRKKS